MDFRLDLLRCRSFREIEDKLAPTLENYGYLFPRDKAAKILLKPNLNANMNALTGNTTDLRLMSALIELLKDKGYRSIIIGEGTNSGFYRNRIGVIARLKVDKLADYYGIEVVDFNYSEPYTIQFEDGVRAQVARECIEADLFINLPKLKTHFEAGMSVCLKSLIGCLLGQENKKKTHLNLAANILRINQVVKPHLHIVDGLIAMEGLGPTRGTPIRLDTLIIGTDPYLIDLSCAHLAGFDYRRVTTLKLAEQNGALTSEHHEFAKRFNFQQESRKFKPPEANWFAGFIHHPRRQKYFLAVRNTPLFSYLASTEWFGRLLFLTGLRQDVFSREEIVCKGLSLQPENCNDCGVCDLYCPLGLDLPGSLLNREGRCLECLYCFMVCPQQAIRFEGTFGFMQEQLRQYDKLVRNLNAEPSKEKREALEQ